MKTIKTLFRIIVAFGLLLGWGLAASAIHVVWTGDKPVIIPKATLGARDTYGRLIACKRPLLVQPTRDSISRAYEHECMAVSLL